MRQWEIFSKYFPGVKALLLLRSVMCTQKKQVDELFPTKAFSSGQVLSKEAVKKSPTFIFISLYLLVQEGFVFFVLLKSMSTVRSHR